MLIPFKLEIPVYIHKDDLQPLYESLLAIKNISKNREPAKVFPLDQFMEAIQEKLNYLKYREAEIDDRLRQEKEEKELRDPSTNTKS